MSLRAIIAEDSQQNIDTLMYLLKDRKELQIKAVVKTLAALQGELEQKLYDIAFLDIQFKKGNVFSVLEKIVESNIELPEIIFITAHGSFEYATKAIQFACLDFINKPIDPDQLNEVIVKYVERKKSAAEQKKQLEFLLNLLEGDMNQPQSMAIVKPKGIIEYLNLDDLIYIQADKTTSIFYTIEGKKFSVKHLGYYLELLSNHDKYVQTSRSCLLNIDYIRDYNPQSRVLNLTNGETLSVSHRYNKKFKNYLQQKDKSSLAEVIERLKNFFK